MRCWMPSCLSIVSSAAVISSSHSCVTARPAVTCWAILRARAGLDPKRPRAR
jgi:hypothetical protein